MRWLEQGLKNVGSAVADSVTVPTVSAQEVIDPKKEYNLKAVFFYSFGRYITWNRQSANVGDFKIGVLGDSPIVQTLQQIAQKRNLDGRTLTVEVVSSAEQLSGYQLLFVSGKITTAEVSQLISNLPSDTIVVGERDDLADVGASIIFFIDGTSVRFELNRENLQAKDVQLDAKLLRLSRSR